MPTDETSHSDSYFLESLAGFEKSEQTVALDAQPMESANVKPEPISSQLETVSGNSNYDGDFHSQHSSPPLKKAKLEVQPSLDMFPLSNNESSVPMTLTSSHEIRSFPDLESVAVKTEPTTQRSDTPYFQEKDKQNPDTNFGVLEDSSLDSNSHINNSSILHTPSLTAEQINKAADTAFETSLKESSIEPFSPKVQHIGYEVSTNEVKSSTNTEILPPPSLTATISSAPVVTPSDPTVPSTVASSIPIISSVPVVSSSLPVVPPIVHNVESIPAPISQSSAIVAPVKALPPLNPRKHRLVLLYDKPRYYHIIMQLKELRESPDDIVTVLELSEINSLLTDKVLSNIRFDHLNICIEYNDEFENNLRGFAEFIEQNPAKISSMGDIGYHIHFAPGKKWKDYKEYEIKEYNRFLDVLNKVAGDKVVHCSVINKYDMDTVYITERNELAKLGQEIQGDIEYWKHLKVLDYGESSIRFLPGVQLPDSLQVLNIGGGYALETLTGFKMPPKLKTLLAGQGAVHSIDNIVFPATLESLGLEDNKIYLLNYVEFPATLKHLDISQNRIESLRGVNFPEDLISLNLGFNPIDSIKGVKFPETLRYLEVSNIPNESMTGVKFPDNLEVLNLQSSMTTTRGLKLPSNVKTLILTGNGVNSINPLKLPNSVEILYLNDNNIKTLNKVQFPTALKELYLGDNMITTLKNVTLPPTLEILDLQNDPDAEEHEKYITTLKDVVFPPNLKVLKLGYHSIKIIESIDFPYSLTSLYLSYNDLKLIRGVRFGNYLKLLDLSGNPELTNIDNLVLPESLAELRVPVELIPNLPAYIIDRANKKQLLIKKGFSP
ncbi:hypothetical protein G9P44_004834 [Scheffersomyces stipitis]|nr:hypothetical protein G9P44_004834 [Scheffersomyces stipitis]